MGLPRLFYSFRTRLLLVMALLLVATVGVQYYFGRIRSRDRAVRVAGQEQALTASIALANESITSSKYMFELEKRARQVAARRVQGDASINVLVVRDRGRAHRGQPRPRLPGPRRWRTARRTTSSSPTRSVQAARSAWTRARRPRASSGCAPSLKSTTQPVSGEPRTFAIPLQTERGLVYIVIVLGTTPMSDGSFYETMRPLAPTLVIMLVSTLGAGILVWRFTRPLNELSRGAQRVAAGDFSFHVPGADRKDEVGRLAATFNEMIAQLGRMRELETQVQQAEQSAVIGRLASAIAHEIRNPLELHQPHARPPAHLARPLTTRRSARSSRS